MDLDEVETQSEFVDFLIDLLNENNYRDLSDIRTFNDAGLLTSNEGLVVRLNSGVEFQVTVVRKN